MRAVESWPPVLTEGKRNDMLNPYALLAALLAFLAVAFGGYRYGYSRAEDAQASAVATAQVEAIDKANRDTEVATKRAVAQAKAESAARLSAVSARLKGEQDAALKAKPECSRDADSQRLLLESIRLANDSAASASPVPDAVHADP